MLRRLFPVMALAGLALGALPASAVRAESAPSARALSLAGRYLIDAQAQRILANEGPVVAQYMLSKIPEPQGGQAKAEEVRQAMIDAADAAVKDKLPEFMSKSAAIYAKVFSEQELTGIVAFFDSPAGHAFVAKTNDAAGPMAELIRSLGDEIQIDTRRRFCAQEADSCKAAAPDGAAKGE